MGFKIGDRIKHQLNPDRHIIGDVIDITVNDYIVKPSTGILTLNIIWMDDNYTLVDEWKVDKILEKYSNR